MELLNKINSAKSTFLPTQKTQYCNGTGLFDCRPMPSPASFPILFLAGLFLLSCSNGDKSAQNKESKEEKSDLTRVSYTKPSSSFHDTFTIVRPSAVFYNPDSLQLKKIQRLAPNDEFQTSVHNCFYQMKNARAVIKNSYPLIQIVEVSTARFLLFIKGDKSKSLIDLDTRGDMCGLFLFDGTKDPELIDMMNIETALGFYFGAR